MVRRNGVLALLVTTAAVGFEWKMDGDKLATDDAGNPVWVNGTNELSVKGDTISSLQGEAKRNRQRAETAEAAAAKFEGIDDPEAAKVALQTVADLKDGDLINKGKLDEVKTEITKQYEKRVTDAEAAAAAANQRADNTLLDSVFTASEFAKDRLTVPVEMVRATFGDRFKVENGKVVAYGADGQPIYSDKNLGEPATFDEALEKIVTGYKHKDTILKAPDAGGSGSGGAGGNRGKGRTLSRAEFEALPPNEQADFAGKMRTGEASIA